MPAVDNGKGTVTGAIASIRYQNSGFIIASLDDGTCILGNILEPVIGLEYEFSGEWSEHPRFGKQFKFSSYASKLPKTNVGIVRYLVRVAKWVDTVRANAVVNTYGEQTLDILKNDPQRVARDIKGISIKRADEIREFLLRNEKLEGVTVEVESILSRVRGLPKRIASDLLSKYASNAAAKLKENPYVLTAFPGVGFKLADAVALCNDYPRADPRRQCAAIEHVLEEAAQKRGHTRLKLADTLACAHALIGLTPNVGLAYAAMHGRVRHLPGDYLALPDIAISEGIIAARVADLLATPLQAPVVTDPAGLAEDQREAVELLGRHRFGVLQGPPGSGKTYTFARFVKGLHAAGFTRIGYAAPTGKAAQRMTESLQDTVPGARAETIHRMLGPQMTGDGFTFTYGEGFPLSYNAIIVDEASMIDVHLAAALLSATTPDMYVLFVGDPNQLPSIGPGAVLSNLAEAGVPTARLEKIKRNAGRIVRACHSIKAGEYFEWSESVDLDGGENLRHIPKQSESDIVRAIVRIAEEKIKPMGFDLFWEFQVIAPTNKKGGVSCEAINKAMGQLLNPGPVDSKLGFREGDRVVRIKNGIIEDRELPGYVVNGDIGRVVEIETKRVIVKFINPDRTIALPRNDHCLLRAYCMTCHRLQGSDAPVVVIPLHKSFGRFPTREWIYTAISRAKTLCVTVGAASIALNMVGRVSAKRDTHLVKALECLKSQ